MKARISKKSALAKKMLSLVIIVFLVMSMSGCWDSRELDSVSIILGVGIDTVPFEDDLNYIFQLNKSLPSSGQNSSSSESDKQFYNVEAKSIGLKEAQQKIDLNLSRTLFMQHNQFVMVGKDKAKRTVEDCLDVFLREGSLRMEILMLVAEHTAKEVMTVDLQQESVVAVGIYRLVERLGKKNKAFESKIYKFVTDTNDVSATAIAPIIGLNQTGENDLLEIKGFAIFKDYIMVGELSLDYVKAYSWIRGYYKSTVYDVNSEKMYASINIPVIKYEIKTAFNKKNEPVINLKYYITGKIGELIASEKMETIELEDYLEAELSRQFVKQLYDCINYCKAMGVDIFGFGSVLHKNNLKQWKKIENNWDEYYKNLEVNIEAEFRIFSDGKIDDYIDYHKEENQ